MTEFEDIRRELREAVNGFQLGEALGQGGAAKSGANLPKHLNVYLFGPQGSGKTSFIRTIYRALHGPTIAQNDDGLQQLEISLHRSDDGTSMYSVYELTSCICIHDTRGQREYTDQEMQQLRLILEGRARPGTLIQQRKRYWLLLREFWRSDERMRRTFSRRVMVKQATLDTEPHFVFLVIDPNQQELLLEDQDFRECYGGLVGDFQKCDVPYAILCTHGDTLTDKMRRDLQNLPAMLSGEAKPPAPEARSAPETVPRVTSLDASGGYFEVNSALYEPGSFEENFQQAQRQAAPPQPPPAPAPSPGPGTRLPEIMRIITNYTDACEQRLPDWAKKEEYPPKPPCPPMMGQDLGAVAPVPALKPRPLAEEDSREHVQQDIHILLVLLDALRQADHQIVQRATGARPAPLQPAATGSAAPAAETGCPLL